jgi:ribosome modulation factor
MGSITSQEEREHRLQSAARRRGLKLVCDRQSVLAGGPRFFLRPTWDARKTVLPTIDGRYTLANLSEGRRIENSLMSLDEIERLLEAWDEPRPTAPARLPWQAWRLSQPTDAIPGDEISRIPRDTKARREGYFAGRRGRSATDNPYQRDSKAALEWLVGLTDGCGRRLKTASSR